MIFHVGIENNVEGRSLAWVLDHPGCFVYGSDASTALAATRNAILKYASWISEHYSGPTLVDVSDIEIRVAETWDVYTIDENFDIVDGVGYEVNAWFQHDWKPLTNDDIERGLKLLSWTRQDLLETVRGLSHEVLHKGYPGERWSIGGILKHIGGAEWWYMDRLGISIPKGELPSEPFERLDVVRSHFTNILPTLAGSRQVVGIDGEFWSPRKILRRAVWHERDHTIHIQKLITL